MNELLVPIDLSSTSLTALRAATRLARAMDAKLVLLTVLVEPVFVREYAPPPAAIEKITTRHERGVTHQVEQLQQAAGRLGVTAEVVIRRGDAVREILDLAQRRKVELIVMGAHGHSAIFELLLGSTTQRVLKRARCPVVVIPPGMPKDRVRRPRA